MDSPEEASIGGIPDFLRQPPRVVRCMPNPISLSFVDRRIPNHPFFLHTFETCSSPEEDDDPDECDSDDEHLRSSFVLERDDDLLVSEMPVPGFPHDDGPFPPPPPLASMPHRRLPPLPFPRPIVTLSRDFLAGGLGTEDDMDPCTFDEFQTDADDALYGFNLVDQDDDDDYEDLHVNDISPIRRTYPFARPSPWMVERRNAARSRPPDDEEDDADFDELMDVDCDLCCPSDEQVQKFVSLVPPSRLRVHPLKVIPPPPHPPLLRRGSSARVSFVAGGSYFAPVRQTLPPRPPCPPPLNLSEITVSIQRCRGKRICLFDGTALMDRLPVKAHLAGPPCPIVLTWGRTKSKFEVVFENILPGPWFALGEVSVVGGWQASNSSVQLMIYPLEKIVRLTAQPEKLTVSGCSNGCKVSFCLEDLTGSNSRMNIFRADLRLGTSASEWMIRSHVNILKWSDGKRARVKFGRASAGLERFGLPCYT